MSLADGKRFARGLAWGQLGALGRSAFAFAFAIVAARFLGPDEYGRYAALLSVVLLFTRLSEVGSQGVLGNYLPRWREQGRDGAASALLRALLVLRGGIAVALAMALIVWPQGLGWATGDAGLTAYAPILALWLLLRSMMDLLLFAVWAMMAMRRYALTELSVSVAQLAVFGWLAQSGLALADVLWLMILVSALQLVSFAHACLPVLRVQPESVRWGPVVAMGATLWVTTVVHFALGKGMDILMISYFTQLSRNAAFYDVAYLLVIAGAGALLSAVDHLMLPRFSAALARGGIPALREAWVQMQKLSLFLALPLLLFLALLAAPLVQAFYGDDYLPAVPLITVFALFSVLSVVAANELSLVVLLALGRHRQYLWLRVAAGVANIAFNLALIPYWGALGAVLATAGGRLLFNLIEYRLAQRHAGLSLPYGYTVRLLAVAMVCLLPLWWWAPGGLSALVVAGALYGMLVLWLGLRLFALSQAERSGLLAFAPPLRHIVPNGWC